MQDDKKGSDRKPEDEAPGAADSILLEVGASENLTVFVWRWSCGSGFYFFEPKPSLTVPDNTELPIDCLAEARMRGAEAFEITNKQTYNFNSMSEAHQPRSHTKRIPAMGGSTLYHLRRHVGIGKN